MKRFKYLCLLTVFLSCFAMISVAGSIQQDLLGDHVQIGTIVVNITDLHNDKGQVCVKLYNSKGGFPNDTSKTMASQTANIQDNKAEVSFDDLPYGIYAVAAYHDENSNGKQDVNWFPLYIEGSGTSTNLKECCTPQTFEEAAFVLNRRTVSVPVKIRY